LSWWERWWPWSNNNNNNNNDNNNNNINNNNNLFPLFLRSQDPLVLLQRPMFGGLGALGNKLQLQLYCTYQLSRHWGHFRKLAAKAGGLQDGWDVLSAVDFTRVRSL
jgi:hypothetical protein